MALYKYIHNLLNVLVKIANKMGIQKESVMNFWLKVKLVLRLKNNAIH
jgi:hypothetical protein